MKIVADENIPLLNAFFQSIGDITTYPGREIGPEQVADADILLVRSVTQVNQALLANSSVRFVGTCTIGTDHIDLAYLEAQEINFAAAPGCNANAVVEYVVSVLDVLAEQQGFNWQDKVVGIVGKGNVGDRLYQVLNKLGITCLVSDPILEAAEDESCEYVSLDQLLAESDIVTLHTPLTEAGDYPTHHLLDAARLDKLKPNAILINASRGAVVDNQALMSSLSAGKPLTVALDVWEQEPEINRQLLPLITIATPHIAGYSVDGKIAGTEMVYRAICRAFGLPSRVRVEGIKPLPKLKALSFSSDACLEEVLSTSIRSVYDVRQDDALLRNSFRALAEDASTAQVFDSLRKHYRSRREFSTVKVKIKKCSGKVSSALKALNFNVVTV
ncbi:4-phosphoerythronate dehydrogenase PdxB [Endozoicomonas sp. SM1973]|uniref:Erythronate-4-phosphate dehydrogenase n=1 Tax=Spartinivicinus marinus TaxID=2994442 RepID=A0A853HWJ6_9GAMM|nr:4-phosphoerythronate dehydrogenase PdxB [Spartinivicinus marinus]MCX4029987.1 4-phosphoerythronate dehydrogenase PdxB [Spartinivicinus marinus]NYZ64769.1 4-phosphoerythronate dehydrogenase PdxB [Spartinivicinus marinus]